MSKKKKDLEVQNDQDYQEKVKTRAAGPASMLGLGLGRPCDASLRKLGCVLRKISIQNDKDYQQHQAQPAC